LLRDEYIVAAWDIQCLVIEMFAQLNGGMRFVASLMIICLLLDAVNLGPVIGGSDALGIIYDANDIWIPQEDLLLLFEW
jgi:hypothetical protein